MTKTHDEIKKGLAVCSADECHGQHTDCPYHPELMCIRNICRDALALIQQLQADLEDMTARYKIADDCAKKKGVMNEKLYAELTAAKAERDAAVEDLESYATLKCFACKYYEEELTEVPCDECKILGKGNRDMFEWRGVHKD